MPLIGPGPLVVLPDGTATGVGLAKDLYDAEIAAYPSFAGTSDPQAVAAKTAIAAKCLAQATIIDAYIRSATVTVPGITPGPGSAIAIIT
jgi:hypothetical protein